MSNNGSALEPLLLDTVLAIDGVKKTGFMVKQFSIY